ncbi:dockerin type I repeat-containing protein [uncultured Ruminococcus sp.]|uniref:dockerin type I repeat-containing protein n=1 Tax=uncultured Ruminococcus sp. TaxID=165186 RepID=UPI0025D6DC3D|nr:dockerin type I repeat-containing protein [uncultured Ruminococcus sp.]
MKIFNKHIGRSAACLLIAAAMLPAVLPANAETLPNADKAVNMPNGGGYGFTLQPLPQIVISQSNLNTACAGFLWETAYLVEEDGTAVKELEHDPEDPFKINAEITEDMVGKTLKFRAFIDSESYVDSYTFVVLDYNFIDPPYEAFLSPSDLTATLEFKTSFDLAKAELYSDEGELIKKLSVDKKTNTIKVSLTAANGNKQFYVNATSTEGYDIQSYFTVNMPDVKVSDSGLVIPQGADSVGVDVNTNFLTTGYTLYCDGKAVEKASVDPGYYFRVNVNKKYAGHSLSFEVDIKDWGPQLATGKRWSESFSVQNASTKHHFVKQPNDMLLTTGETPELTWELDFEPERCAIINEFNDEVLHAVVSKKGEMDAKTFFTYMHSDGDLRLRAFYGEGKNDYIDSEPFKFTYPTVTKEPASGYCTEGGTLEITWDYSFVPVKQEILTYKKGSIDPIVESLGKNVRSLNLNGRGVDKYYIKAYFIKNSDMYAITGAFKVVETGREIFKIITDDPNVFCYNVSLDSESINAAEGDTIGVTYWLSDFEKWDGEASGVTFEDEYRYYTNFEMPNKDVTVKVKTKNQTASKPGDVNSDGVVNVSDISKVAAHVKSLKSLTDEEKKLADVNNDNAVTVTDVSKIAAHVKGVKPL